MCQEKLAKCKCDMWYKRLAKCNRDMHHNFVRNSKSIFIPYYNASYLTDQLAQLYSIQPPLQLAQHNTDDTSTHSKDRKDKQLHKARAFLPVSYTHLTLPTKRI